jgi:hypothetical protein
MLIAELGGNVPTKMQCQVHALDSSDKNFLLVA